LVLAQFERYKNIVYMLVFFNLKTKAE
jgi:hypothetical protein